MKYTTLSLLLGAAASVHIDIETEPIERETMEWIQWIDRQMNDVTPDEADRIMETMMRAQARIAIES